MKYLFLLFFLFLLLNKIIGLNNNSENTKKQNIFDRIFNRHGHNLKNKTKEFEDTKTKCVYCQNPTIELTGGKIEGRFSFVAGKNNPAIVFEGIPFSEPPIGKLRFLPLKEKKPWTGILNTTKYSAACLSKTKNCPILFYIHGGGFAYDSATMFNDTQIIQKYSSDGIIFVIPAYRLGAFGLLDLGNDKTVKRNLAMHDIIFALEWVQKEIHNFGGNNKRITAMGNSAGASALMYLCGSPAVREGLFQQAFISSGVPFFTKDANLKQSFALLEHFNCLRDNSTNKTFSDKQKVECLRKIDSLDLLRQQQYNENFDIVFSGPESDTEILPFDNYVHLLRNWKPIPLMITTTIIEFDRWSDDRLDKECFKATGTFGYYSPQSYNACFDRYKDEFNLSTHMRVSYESLHSEAFLTSLVNTRFGGVSYVGEFEIANYSNHASDMYFFIGLHPIELNRTDLKLMNNYYPKMVKNFIRGHSPDKSWRPQTWNGRNYFRITFNVSDNNTILEAPHNVDGYQARICK
uniref:Carboxylesterase type B domain-containing protein n=1 Tax=Meloidogyne incognita TaxID=6306 RepID=A0A914N4Z2_MELIC